MAAGADEQVGAEGALELVDLVAQRRLGDVQARGGPTEMELLGDGQEVAEQARLEIDSPRLTLARGTGLGQKAISPRQSVQTATSFGRSTS